MKKNSWTLMVFGFIVNSFKTPGVLVLKRKGEARWTLPNGKPEPKDKSFPSVLARVIDEQICLNRYLHNWRKSKLISIYPSFFFGDLYILYFLKVKEEVFSRQTKEMIVRFVSQDELSKEILLPNQGQPGNQYGRIWEMCQDGFSYIEKNYKFTNK